VEVTDRTVLMVLPLATCLSLFTRMIRIFLFLWSTIFEAVPAARVDSTVNLGMVAWGVEVELQLPGV
jgi:hypothetical protein